MDFGFPPETESLRAELRAWLDEHAGDRIRELRVELDAGDEWLLAMRAWNAALYDAGFAVISWPPELGGRGGGLLDQVVVLQELARAGVPGPLNVVGLSNIAPAIMQFGTDEQKRRHLVPMARGDEIWCQGFSEPDAGSDLASLSTRAVLDGDHYVVTGQKVWCTLGAVARWCELLVRTDPSAPKHKGLSCLLVDLSSPGVEVRPLVTMTGDREFSEIHLDGVRVPVTSRLGEENQGWLVAMATLAHERGGVASLHLGARRTLDRLVELARAGSGGTLPAGDPLVRQRLAELHGRATVLERLADRAITQALGGLPPGADTSIAKLVWSQLEQDLAEAAPTVVGLDADRGAWARERLTARSFSIAGGTTEVNKNILAERVLGLPRG